MSGLDKIIEHIESSAANSAAELISAAEKEAGKIMAQGKAAAHEKEAAVNKQTEADVMAARKRIEGEAELFEKRFLLQAKQDVVLEVLAEGYDKLTNLPDKEYFDNIIKMVKKYSSGAAGEIVFCERDKKRLPKDFEKRVNEAGGAGLRISSETAQISGGFILDYGDIEENCSFEALFGSLRDKLQDKIGEMLFE